MQHHWRHISSQEAPVKRLGMMISRDAWVTDQCGETTTISALWHGIAEHDHYSRQHAGIKKKQQFKHFRDTEGNFSPTSNTTGHQGQGCEGLSLTIFGRLSPVLSYNGT